MRPDLVVDLGTGTGLSTEMWLGRAGSVVGIEPNEDMRRQAVARLGGIPELEFRPGVSADTGLPDGSADIVTCSQSLHWMEPEATFREVGRILRPGGVFAAIDCDWPPTINPAAEIAYRRFMHHDARINAERDLEGAVRRWEKSGHLGRMHESGVFGWTKELAVHGIEEGDADRLVGVALSQASVARLLLAGLSEEAVGLDVFRREAVEALPEGPVPWYWTYRVRVGVV